MSSAAIWLTAALSLQAPSLSWAGPAGEHGGAPGHGGKNQARICALLVCGTASAQDSDDTPGRKQPFSRICVLRCLLWDCGGVPETSLRQQRACGPLTR